MGGLTDGWMDDNIRNISARSMGIRSQRRLYTVIQNEWDEAVLVDNIQIQVPHPPPT